VIKVGKIQMFANPNPEHDELVVQAEVMQRLFTESPIIK
jgi:hypothetical protein